MKAILFFRGLYTVAALLMLPAFVQAAAPPNDNCSGASAAAYVLASSNTCSTTGFTLDQATASAGTFTNCVGAAGATHYDVWFTFTALTTSHTVTISGFSAQTTITNPEVQILSNTGGCAGTFTTLVCGATTATATGLTVGTVYYIRVSQVGTSPNGNGQKPNFDICVTNPPLNDDCGNAGTLTSANTCSTTSGGLVGATASSPAVASSCTATPGSDVWYKYVATNTYPTITLSNIGNSLSSAGVSLQIYSGTCGSFTTLDCASGTGNSLSINTYNSPTFPGFVTGTTYYIRVFTPATTQTGTGWTFDICITNSSSATANITYSKSYINVSKGYSGGVVDKGDTLEFRTTFVINNAGSADSLSFTDTLFNTKGLALVPGSISLRTNEGKVYKSFTDGFDTDAGWQYTSGLDTVVRINFGNTANSFKTGRLNYQSKPSVFNNTCIVMATYRAVVYAPYNTKINFKTGSLTYRDLSVPATVNKITFAPNNLIVYQSPGLCPNAVSASNAVGAESNGTFGTPSGVAPLARNRGTSSSTSYLYSIFRSGAGPNDLYYGVPNNTSGSYTTINTWPKPDNSSPTHRIFNLWDIIGDHTGATNTAFGNSPCDTTKAVNTTTNPCGYMLVINSAYKADTAFQYTASNLCPNTYYEISAWVRNICYKCGCDSNGVSATGANYIPLAPGDSSGVQPNLAFDVNGTDYYTTGNIQYFGTTAQNPLATPGNSDSLNKWVKRGFTYLTGPSETSFTLTIRNNAPGGGGNDWAMDDISIATCLPNMQYSPTTNPTTCQANTVTIKDTVTSYFNNYTYYKWQRSTNGGTTWTDISGQSGAATPVSVSSGWRYITSYTIPPTSTTTANNGDKYRVTVATTSSNLSNTNCQFTDGISIINLTVLSNCTVLPTKIISFNGKLLSEHATLFWTTSKEEEPVKYSIEKSIDGINFSRIGILNSYSTQVEENHYSFTDSARLKGKAWYRIVLIDEQNRSLYSRIIMLNQQVDAFTVSGVVNPFINDLPFDVSVTTDSKISVALYNLSGTRIKQQTFAVYKGMNGLTLTDLKGVAKGMYLLQVQCNGQTAVKKVVKQ